MNWTELLIMVAVVAVTFVLCVVLIKKGVLKITDLSTIEKALEDLKPITGSSLFAQIMNWVNYAVHAAEQMCKTGEIDAGDRKTAAMTLVKTYAEVDGVSLTDTDMQAVDTMIEAECDNMGHKTIEA